MSREVYRYQIHGEIAMAEIEATLLLAILAVEGLYGEAQTRLDALHFLDVGGRRCVIDASTTLGIDLNRVFTALLLREVGMDGFDVERSAEPTPVRSPVMAA